MLSGLRTPVIILLTVFLCLCTHELGHAVAGWLTGGTVTQFALFSMPPYVRIAGGASPAQEAFRDAAGSGGFLLVYVLFAVATLWCGGEWQMVRYAASLFAAIEIAGWVLSSVFSSGVMGPNDARDFLAATGASPYLVAGVAAGVGATGWFLLRLARLYEPSEPGQQSRETVHVLTKTATGE